MTPAELMGAILFGITVIGGLAAAWWRVEGTVRLAKADAMAAASQARVDSLHVANLAAAKADILSDSLAAHRLHVAETYVSKSGLREQTDQIMGAINGITDRLDRFMEARPRTRT